MKSFANKIFDFLKNFCYNYYSKKESKIVLVSLWKAHSEN